MPNLILTRRAGESILVDGAQITVARIHRGRVVLSIQAPPQVRVVRSEISQASNSKAKTHGAA